MGSLRLPLLAQLVTGSYHDEKTKNVGLAHASGQGAPCTNCEPGECSGLDLHFWRKICKNCGCRPQVHDIKLNKTVHEVIVRDLFQAKDGGRTLSDTSDEGVTPYGSTDVKGGKRNSRFGEIPKITVTTDVTGSLSEGLSSVQLGDDKTSGSNTNSASEERGKNPAAPPPPLRKDSYRAMERQRQLMNQLPPQDFDAKFCSTLNRKEMQAMNKMADIKKQACGKGKQIQIDGSERVFCKSCDGEMNTGESAIISKRDGEKVHWHPECFKCNTCNEKIADLIFFWHDGDIYCGRHFGEKYKPRCAACDELIFAAKFTEAEGKKWHREHFACLKCDKDLAGANYISHKGQPHCMTCYHFKIANKCNACGMPIQVGEERISHENLHWHAYKECFFCHGCNKDLVDVGFLIKDQKTYCSTKCTKHLESSQ